MEKYSLSRNLIPFNVISLSLCFAFLSAARIETVQEHQRVEDQEFYTVQGMMRLGEMLYAGTTAVVGNLVRQLWGFGVYALHQNRSYYILSGLPFP
jgi:hypothetical protein